jgi:hypothetical protein
MSKKNKPLERLKYHISGAIERGEAKPIEAVVAPRHTPGPWEVRLAKPEFNSSDLWIWSESTGHVASISAVYSNGHANARLIAAAPDLLKFVKRFDNDRYCDADQINETHSNDCEACIARALIAKAEGK